MKDLLSEMRRCKTVDDCIALATLDAYGEYEEAAGWQACLESIFSGTREIKVLGDMATLEGFDLVNELSVVAVCRRRNRTAKVAPESIEFPTMTKIQQLWLQAWKEWSHA